MCSVGLRFDVLAWATLSMIFNFMVFSAVGQGQDVETEQSFEGDLAHFSELIDKLGSVQFNEREDALGKLLELPVSALPWLRDKLGKLEDGANVEICWRLTKVVTNLSQQKASSALSGIFANGAIFAPFDCVVFIEPVGGRAGASSEVGLGTSPEDFRAFIRELPRKAQPSPVRLGTFKKDEAVPLAISSEWGGTHFAFSGSRDETSLCAFTDTDGSLKQKGLQVIEAKGDRFLMRLDDAASIKVDDNDEDILIEIWFEPLEGENPADESSEPSSNQSE